MFGQIWRERVLPGLIERACGGRPIERQRGKVVPRARGRVLEIGFGSGMNLPFFDRARVDSVTGLDPSGALMRRSGARASLAPFPVFTARGTADAIPFADASFDTVVMTYTLCSVPDVHAALREIHRVLAPGGELVFSEHGLAPDRAIRWVQRGLTPAWRVVGGGCHLDRDVPALLGAAGFEVSDLGQRYLPGPRWLNWHSWGFARATL